MSLFDGLWTNDSKPKETAKPEPVKPEPSNSSTTFGATSITDIAKSAEILQTEITAKIGEKSTVMTTLISQIYTMLETGITLDKAVPAAFKILIKTGDPALSERVIRSEISKIQSLIESSISDIRSTGELAQLSERVQDAKKNISELEEYIQKMKIEIEKAEANKVQMETILTESNVRTDLLEKALVVAQAQVTEQLNQIAQAIPPMVSAAA